MKGNNRKKEQYKEFSDEGNEIMDRRKIKKEKGIRDLRKHKKKQFEEY